MIFNGVEKNYIRVRRELFRPPTPPIEYQTIEKPSGGSKVKRKRFTDITLLVPIRISSNKRIEELKEDMSRWLVHDEPKQLVFKDAPNRYYLAYYQEMELDQYPYYAKGTINFYLPEGYRFGEKVDININTQPTPATITGQEKTPWKCKTVFEVPQEKFTLGASNGLYILLNYNFIAGDVLEIDYTTRSATLNGKNIDTAISIKSVFKELEPGQMEFVASHKSTVSYTERYY